MPTLTLINNYKTYLFDLDGTLLDTAPDIAYAVNEVRRSEGLPPLGVSNINESIGYGAGALLTACLPTSLHWRLTEMRARFVSAYAENLCVRTKPFPMAEKCLRTLAQRSDILIGLITNKPARFARPLLREVGWEGLFDLTLYGDSLPYRKPSPEPLLQAMRTLGVESEDVLYIGDTEVDIEAAMSASVDIAIVRHGRAVGIVNNNQKYSKTRIISLADLIH